MFTIMMPWPHFTDSSIADRHQPPSPPFTLPGIKLEPADDQAVRLLPRSQLKRSPRASPLLSATASPPMTEIVSGSAFNDILSPHQSVNDREIYRDITRQTAPYAQGFDPTREPRQSPGSVGHADCVFSPYPPLKAPLSGIYNSNYDAAFSENSGGRRELPKYGNSKGNTNPRYRSPSPPLQRAQSEDLRLVSDNTTYHGQMFRRRSLVGVAAYHRSASGGNIANLPQSAPRFNPYERQHDSRSLARRPIHEYSIALIRPRGSKNLAMEISQSKSKRKRADPEQLAILVNVFERTPFPSTEERYALALRLGMTSRSVQIWFQNRRQTTKAAQMSAAQIAAIAANEELGASRSPGHRRLSIQQLEALNDQFWSNAGIPDETTKQALARDLGLHPAFVRAWLVHRRSGSKVDDAAEEVLINERGRIGDVERRE